MQVLNMKRDDDDGSVNDDGSGDTFKLSPSAPMQVLNMTGNDLREVGGQAFSSAGLLNLQRVITEHINISSHLNPEFKISPFLNKIPK